MKVWDEGYVKKVEMMDNVNAFLHPRILPYITVERRILRNIWFLRKTFMENIVWIHTKDPVSSLLFIFNKKCVVLNDQH